MTDSEQHLEPGVVGLGAVPMEELGHEIDAAESASSSNTVIAATKLLEARRRFDAGETCGAQSWEKWIGKFTHLSSQRARALLQIAKAADPITEHKQQKRRNAERMKNTRALARASGAQRSQVDQARAQISLQPSKTKTPEELAASAAEARASHIRTRYMIMISAWDMSPEEARAQFLDKIGATLNVRLRLVHSA
jgi:hypothetical protein